MQQKNSKVLLKRLFFFYQSVMHSKHENKSIAYIVDGKTLSYIFKYNFDNHFRDVCMMCDAVLCCRMSPAQKAQVIVTSNKFFVK